MVSKTKRGREFKAFFDDFIERVGGLPGVIGVVGNEWPGPEIVVFLADNLDARADEELTDQVSDATVEVLEKFPDIDTEFHIRNLRGTEFLEYDLAACDLVYAGKNGQ